MTQENESRVRNKLRAEYPDSEEGVWEVKGEDPNCDMGGAHIMPLLGFFSGRHDEVVEYALTLPGFFQWGGGGSVKKVEATPVRELLKERDERQAALNKLTDREKGLLGLDKDGRVKR